MDRLSGPRDRYLNAIYYLDFTPFGGQVRFCQSGSVVMIRHSKNINTLFECVGNKFRRRQCAVRCGGVAVEINVHEFSIQWLRACFSDWYQGGLFTPGIRYNSEVVLCHRRLI